MATEISAESDEMYVGFASRIDPANLQPNYLQFSQNMRLQRGVAQPRKGTKRLTDASLNSQTMVGEGLWIDAEGRDNFVLVFTNRFYLYRPEQGASPEYLSPAYTFPTGRLIASGGVCNVVQALDKLYIFRGKETDARLGTGTSGATAGLHISHSAIANGASGTATATCINGYAHNYAIGDEVTIFNVDSVPLTYLRNSYIVTGVTGTTAFTFTITNNSGSNYTAMTNQHACCVRVKPPLAWSGSGNPYVIPQVSIPDNSETHAPLITSGSVPPADFAFYFQNRLVCNTSKTDLAVSDLLSEEFDFSLNNFIINQGGNDSIVGVLPWIENQFLVFMTKSVYVAYVEPSIYTVGLPPGSKSSITVVSTEVGCLSRRSIVSAGQYVFFLSGKGVYLLSPQLDLKLIGNTLPLSEPIEDVFDIVNFSVISSAVASYYGNRFYIALPTNGATRNNLVLVYNTLNQAWESRDTYPAGMWVDSLSVAAYQNQRRLFLLTNFAGSGSFGGIFLCDEYSGGDQYTGVNGTPVLPFVLPAVISNGAPQLVPIDAYVKTREYTFGSLNEKRYSRGEFQFNNSAGDFVRISTGTHDPDVMEEVLAYQFSGNADGTLRARIAARGTSIDAKIEFVTGRPALKGTSIYAINANRQMISQE